MDLVELIFGNFIGFGLALLVYAISQLYLNSKEKKNEKIKQKNFLSLIRDEIIFNKKAIDLLRNEDFKKGEPILRLKTENKKACWDKIIDFYNENIKLIREISTLYELYRSINHVLEHEPYYFGLTEKDNEISFQRQVALNMTITECERQMGVVEKLIEKELKE